jgi:hypothetical protein
MKARVYGLFLCAALAPFTIAFVANSSGSTSNASSADAGAPGSAGAAGSDGDGAEDATPGLIVCPDACPQLTIERLSHCVDLARACASDAQQRFDTAKSRLDEINDGGPGDADRASAYAAASRDLVRRNDISVRAEQRLTETKARYRNAQTWSFGIGAQADLGYAAGGRGLVGLGVPLTLRSSPAFELVLTPGYDSLRGLPQQAPGADYQFATLRGSLGWLESDGTSLTLGVGGAVREKLAQDSFILAPIALRHRFNNDLGLDLNPVFISEVSFFVEPWIPLAGGRSTTFLGVSVSVGMGGKSLGEQRDLCLSQTDARRLGSTVCRY